MLPKKPKKLPSENSYDLDFSLNPPLPWDADATGLIRKHQLSKLAEWAIADSRLDIKQDLRSNSIDGRDGALHWVSAPYI
jgi:hypothetical protein